MLLAYLNCINKVFSLSKFRSILIKIIFLALCGFCLRFERVFSLLLLRKASRCVILSVCRAFKFASYLNEFNALLFSQIAYKNTSYLKSAVLSYSFKCLI